MKTLYLSDSHTDFLTELKGEKLKSYIEFLSGFEKKLISCAVFTTGKNLTIEDIKKLKDLIELDSELMLSIEDIGFIENEEQLEKLIELRPFSVTLTWNKDNQFSGGALSDNGLTKLGIRTIQQLEGSGIFCDVAHLNRKAFYEFSKLTTLPIYCSHANIFSIFKHRRNLTDGQIKMIEGSAGFLGLTIYQKFISEKRITSEDIARQIDYVIKKFGDKCVGFGSDLFGFSDKFLPEDIRGYLDFDEIRKKLASMGHNESSILRVFYENYLDFAKQSKKSTNRKICAD